MDIHDLIASLDAAVPCDGAWIEFSQYGGGPDECQISGNVQGYQRLGIEFLKASTNSTQQCHVDLEYLVTPDSTVNFDCFTFLDTPVHRSAASHVKDRLFSAGCLLAASGLFSVFVIGCGTIIYWIADILL
jgi:hypothetical protein